MIGDLVYASPESVGVRSEGILKFIRYVEENKINLHSFLFAKGGKIIAEATSRRLTRIFYTGFISPPKPTLRLQSECLSARAR